MRLAKWELIVLSLHEICMVVEFESDITTNIEIERGDLKARPYV